MTTKEKIEAELANLDEARLEELYRLIRSLAQPQPEKAQPGLLAKLKEIQIDAPEDFASNLDAYTNGKKNVFPDLP